MKYELVCEEKQKDCYAIVMNFDETILLNANRKNIELNTEIQLGRFTKLQTITSHQSFVKCLCFSKKRNWFISGGYDGTIRIWEEQMDKTWQQIQLLEENDPCFGRDLIFSIILSESENEFYSCSFYSKIKVWVINQTKWVCKQILNPHTSSVYFLNLSPNGRLFGTISADSFRIWEKNENWEQKQVLEKLEEGNYVRLCFISDDELIALVDVPGNLHTLVNKKGQFKIVQTLKLNDQIDEANEHFPIIYNKQINIIIVRHSQHLYLIERKQSGQYLIRQTINGDYRAGYLTQNGKILVVSRFEKTIMKNKRPSKIPKVSMQIWKLK